MDITRRVRKPKSSLNFDVPEENILSLRKKVWEIKIDPEKLKIFFRHYHKEFIALAVFLVGGILLSSTIKIHAQVANFYPSSCLGGWQNPTLAQGEPEVKDPTDKTSFTEGNSAVLKDAQADIFCGDFKGDVPTDATPDKFTVSLVWAFDSANVEHAEPAPFEEVVPQPETQTEETPVQPTEVKDEVKTEPEPAAFLVKQAHAQEETSTETPQVKIEEGATDPDQNIPAETTKEQTEILAEPETTTTEVLPVETTGESSKSTSDVPAQSEPKKDGFLEVRFTLDGVNWETLGVVSNTEEKISKFDIPVEALSSWEDISKLQISIHELPTFDTNPHVYLDAVELGVEYEDLSTDPPQTLSPDEIVSIIKGTNKYVFFSNIEDEYGIWYVDAKTLKGIHPSLTKLETADLVPSAPFIVGDTIVWLTGEGETPLAINAYNSTTGYSSQTLIPTSTFEEWLPVENTTVTWRDGHFIVHKNIEDDLAIKSPIAIDLEALPPELDTVIVEKASTTPKIEAKDVLPDELTPSFDTPTDETTKTPTDEVKDETKPDEKVPEPETKPETITEPASI